MDAITRATERRITMTTEPMTLLDLAVCLTLLIAIVAIVVNVICLVKEYIKSQNDRAR